MGAHVSVPMYRRTLPQRLRLEGRRCESCGYVHFPPKAACPDCHGTGLTPFEFSGRGEVYAVTAISAAGAPPEFAGGGYHVAIVTLAEGPRITTMLTESAPIGKPVHAVVRRLYEEEGVVRYGFKFAPVDES